MRVVAEILLAFIAPGLIVGSTYNHLLKTGIINTPKGNIIFAIVATAFISIAYIIFALMSWESLFCKIKNCETTVVYSDKNQEKEQYKEKNFDPNTLHITQQGHLNQANQGGINIQSGNNND